MNVLPALAAAMVSLLLGARPIGAASAPAAEGRDETCLWLVAAALALLVR